MIPAVPDVSFDGDKSNACFDQTSSEQQPLTDAIATVSIASGHRLLLEIKGVLRFGRSDHRKRALLEFVVSSCELKLTVDSRLEAVDGVEQSLTIGQTSAADRFRSREFFDRKA